MYKTILVVDDDPVYVELVKDLLDLHHYKVLSAHSGDEALAILHQQQVDVIVSDIEMPKMNGIALHKRVHEKPEMKNTPFIFLTGSEDQHYFHYASENPPARIIRKTEMIEKLVMNIADMTRPKHD